MVKPHFVVTGGHHTSGLVLAQALVQRGYRVTWLGRRQAAVGDRHPSAEFLEVTAAGLSFFDLPMNKLSDPWSLFNPLTLVLGFFRAFFLLFRIQPTAIVSFGSYLGFVVAFAGFLQGIPVFLHEQTVLAGRANRLTAYLARRVYLTWEASRSHFSPRHSLVVGLPLRAGILRPVRMTRFSNRLPTILVLGGKQGAHPLNKLLFSHLSQLLSRYNLVHQTGFSAVTGDYDRALALRDTLSPTLASRYRPVSYLGEQEIGSLLASSALYLGRSGAHITYELAISTLPAILIPYPHTPGYEQFHHARFLSRAGHAVILPQSSLSYPSLQKALTRARRLSPRPLPLPRDATSLIIKDLVHALSL